MPSTATKTSRFKQPAAELEEPSFAEYPSPYEALKREVEGKPTRSKHISHPPTTPGKASALPDMSMTPKSSPFAIDWDIPPSTMGKNNKDTILHQGILNKTYRVAATPHTTRKNKALGTGATPQTANRTRRILDFEDTMSSPLEEAPAPRLRAEFFSPIKGPRTPGVSVQTPGRSKGFGRPSLDPVAAKNDVTRGRSGPGMTGRSTRAWSDDDDDDELLDSPPKTIMFNLPESRVLQTPGMLLLLAFVIRVIASIHK
jgi:DASH complex subunit ASK1